MQKLSKDNNSHIKVKAPTEPKNQSDKSSATSQEHPAEHKTTTETKNSHSPERIEIYCDVAEIKKIWQVLTAPICTGKGVEQPLFTKDELGKYLGAMFYSGAFPDAFKSSVEPELKTIPRGDMRNVLIALMYSCYSLNRNFFRGSNQIMYVTMLKRYFSAFATSKIESTKSILATYTPKGMDVLKNSLDKNPHIYEMLSILKKHKLRH